MKNKDHTEVIRLAHRLRSTSGNIGATYLTDLLSDFEMNYMKKDFKLRADMLNKIEAETKCICQKLLDIIGQQ
jgi:HPt (histidine-containing phosphotransfer) domain-containing protein